MNIIVLSDNHGNQKILDKILFNEKYDLSIHLGDSELPEKTIASLFNYYVSGNNDSFTKYEDFLIIDNLKIFIIHGHMHNINVWNYHKESFRLAFAKNVDVVLHGHTHICNDQIFENKRVICPGSLKYPRSLKGSTYALIEIKNKQITNVIFKTI